MTPSTVRMDTTRSKAAPATTCFTAGRTMTGSTAATARTSSTPAPATTWATVELGTTRSGARRATTSSGAALATTPFPVVLVMTSSRAAPATTSLTVGRTMTGSTAAMVLIPFRPAPATTSSMVVLGPIAFTATRAKTTLFFGHSDRIADFEAAGVLGGDIVDLSAVDADTSVAGNQTFVWNSTSQGGMQVVEGVDGVTIVRLYIDGDPEADAMLTIADINFTASVYTALDFIL
jgi:hypothetical protein